MLAEKTAPPKFLTKTQFLTCLDAIDNPAHSLLFRIPLQTGLRSLEFRTFPEKYVIDHSRNKELVGKARMELLLDPRDMCLKRRKEREIDVPLPLMEDLWHFSVYERPKRARRSAVPQTALILTENGGPYSASAIQRVYKCISDKVGFPVHPHMLRHTYATYTLHELKQRNFEGDPLMYVSDRLGHSSLNTTRIYVHLLKQINAELMLAHEEEINALFARRTANGK